MSNEKMREEFELWFSRETQAFSLDIDLARFGDGSYKYHDAASGWKAWQASRAAIVVELPESIGVTPIGGDGIQEFEDCNGQYLRGFQVVLAIEALGLKVAK